MGGSSRDSPHRLSMGWDQASPRMDSSLPQTRKNMMARAIRLDDDARVFLLATPKAAPMPAPMKVVMAMIAAICHRDPTGLNPNPTTSTTRTRASLTSD